MDVSPFRQRTALLPIAMSLAALGIVLAHAAMYGVVHEADEGTAAHLFQILMVAQLPLVAWYALNGLRSAPRQAARVLAVQLAAALAAMASVYFLT